MKDFGLLLLCVGIAGLLTISYISLFEDDGMIVDTANAAPVYKPEPKTGHDNW